MAEGGQRRGRTARRVVLGLAEGLQRLQQRGGERHKVLAKRSRIGGADAGRLGRRLTSRWLDQSATAHTRIAQCTPHGCGMFCIGKRVPADSQCCLMGELKLGQGH